MVAVGVITRIINARSQAKYFAPIGTTPGRGITTTCQVSHVTCVLQLTGILQDNADIDHLLLLMSNCPTTPDILYSHMSDTVLLETAFRSCPTGDYPIMPLEVIQ